MANYESVRVYEASTVLRGIAEEFGVIPSDSEEALDFLGEVGWDAVARKIANYIDKDDSRLNVVTGLRTPEELLFLKSRFPSARVVLIDADQRIRFERHIRRSRDSALTDMKSFSSEDERQKRFGTLRIASDIAEITIHNDGSRDQYSKKIEEALDLISKTPETHKFQTNRSLSELHRSLKALLAIGTAATCEEISALTAQHGSPVRKYNTNRALKAVPEFAHRLERKGESLKYQPTERSLSLLKLLKLLTGTESETSH
jgi:dephospho-CoA kinase